MMALDGKLSYYSLYWTEFHSNQSDSCGDISLKCQPHAGSPKSIDTSSGHHEYLHQISWQKLLRFLVWTKVVDQPVDIPAVPFLKPCHEHG